MGAPVAMTRRQEIAGDRMGRGSNIEMRAGCATKKTESSPFFESGSSFTWEREEKAFSHKQEIHYLEIARNYYRVSDRLVHSLHLTLILMYS